MTGSPWVDDYRDQTKPLPPDEQKKKATKAKLTRTTGGTRNTRREKR